MVKVRSVADNNLMQSFAGGAGSWRLRRAHGARRMANRDEESPDRIRPVAGGVSLNGAGPNRIRPTRNCLIGGNGDRSSEVVPQKMEARDAVEEYG